MSEPATEHPLLPPILGWYDAHARELPWRGPGASAWSVMVSEFMLQQTPVARVLPVHDRWLDRWPTPASLAAEPAGEAVRAWGRLGYPRRALRLHSSAVVITARHGGEVPDSYDDLRALPGVGDYTAAAIAVFAHTRRHPVLDTNVRRVLARTLDGVELPTASVTVGERRRAEALLPCDEATAATWSIGLMELGALVCTAQRPRCAACPVTDRCAWRAAGYPAYDGPVRRGQTWDGTDRQCRGRLLAVVRDAVGAVTPQQLDVAWSDEVQRARCLAGLVEDGLVVRTGAGTFALP